MHHEDGRLLEYLDGELTAEESAAIASHVAECEACAAALERVTGERALASSALGGLAATAAEAVVDTATAQSRISGRPTSRQQRGPRDRTVPDQSLISRVGWSRIAAAAAALLVASSLAFAPVRTFASNILQVFRVEEIQTITFTQADLDELQAALQGAEGHFDLDDLGEIWVEGEQAYDEVTLEEAQARLDFDVILPEGYGDPVLTLASGSTWRFKLDVDNFNELLESFGGSYTLPAELDGEVFVVTIPDALTASYSGVEGGEEEGSFLVVGQTRSPELIVPDGVDPLALRDVILNLPLLPEHLRTQLAAIDDWESTLVIPNVEGTASEIEIAGNPAVLVNSGVADDAEAQPLSDTGVIWNDDGVVRAVGGTITADEAVSLAESMMR